jgi:hypothetical protein
VGQTLLATGLPWKVVNELEHLEGVNTLLVFGDIPATWSLPDHLRVINVLELPGWELPGPSLLERNQWLRNPIAFVVEELFRAYFHSRFARRILDGVGLAHFFLQSPFFRLPSNSQTRSLLDAIGNEIRPRVRANSPLLIEYWGQGSETQTHLVSYARHPQKIQVEFAKPVRGQVFSPDMESFAFEGETLSVTLDVYAVVLLEND